MWTLVGARTRAFGLPSLEVSTFPWGRVTDTGGKESPLIILQLEGRGRISYPGLQDEDECGPSVLDEDDPRALMSTDEELSVVFNLSKIFWLREGKLASCIEEEEEASRAKGDSSWAGRGSHDRRGETGKKLGSRLIAHSKLVI
ncbi:hypothetical protein CRG98_022764 [Punica granatum]|uniref:Uncharacterized protein n=1 Tax=Punica granatum TaxID=22663 RepID=A0A2I0JMR9_PUNGR|nr:hypothetical protein CRG98_022764 [Punica granatum]